MNQMLTQLDASIKEYLSSMDDEQTIKDSLVLIDMMRRITGHEPRLWNVGTIGFDTYHFKYDSGREGDSVPISFYPRNGKITVYIMDGTIRYADMLGQLGRHTSSRVCIYIKRLSDVDLSTLEQILRQSYQYVKSMDGHMHRAFQ
jgi:phosphatidate phosphatase PAH1